MISNRAAEKPTYFSETRTWRQYWNLTSAEHKLQKTFDSMLAYTEDLDPMEQTTQQQQQYTFLKGLHAQIDATKQYNEQREENAAFIRLQRYVQALYFGIYREEQNGSIRIQDYVNGETVNIAGNDILSTALGPKQEADDQAPADSLRDKIDNNIRYCSLGLCSRFYFTFIRLWRNYHRKPFTNMTIVGIIIGVLLYLQSGILNFTPVSSVILGLILPLSVLMVSTFYYLNITNLLKARTARSQASNQEEADLNTISLFNVMSCLGRHNNWVTLSLWLISIVSGAYFILATSNSFAYSCFLTSSAVSFLPIAVGSIYACAAVSALSMVILYALNYRYINGKDGSSIIAKRITQTNSPDVILGVTCDPQSLATSAFHSAKDITKGLLYIGAPAATTMVTLLQCEYQQETGRSLEDDTVKSAELLKSSSIAMITEGTNNNSSADNQLSTGCVVS